MDVDIDPLDIDLEKDPLAAKVFKVCKCVYILQLTKYICAHQNGYIVNTVVREMKRYVSVTAKRNHFALFSLFSL